MTKLKAPVLSLQAQGTIANTITYSRHQGEDIAKSIPTHPDAQTLAQFYQRTFFTDARFYWASLSQAQKDAFRDQPYPQHLTPQQKAIRYYLRYLPDLAAAWSFDSLASNQAKDRSKNALHLTTNFTTTAPGIIATAAYFDGVDDQALLNDHPLLRPISGLTISLFFSRPSLTIQPQIVLKYAPGQECYRLRIISGSKWHFEILESPGNSRTITSIGTYSDINRFYHITAVWQPAIQMALFVDGILDYRRITNIPTTMNQGTSKLYIPWGAGLFKGALDDLRIYNRALSDAHITFLALKQRYPPPS